jgi:hypothetical protein
MAKRKPTNRPAMDMFADCSDMPLFSGTPMVAQDSPYQPASAGQPASQPAWLPGFEPAPASAGQPAWPIYKQHSDGAIYEQHHDGAGWRFYCTAAAWPISPAARSGAEYSRPASQ